MTWRGILIYGENYSGEINPAVYELLGKASELKTRIGGNVSVVVLTQDNESIIAKELVAHGADNVAIYRVKEKERLANSLLHREVVVQAISELKPKLVLISATPWGRSLGPRIAARLKTGITADCLDIYINEAAEIVQVRPAFTGNIIAHIKTTTDPTIATVRPKVFQPNKPDYNRSGTVDIRSVDSIEVSDDTRKISVIGSPRQKTIQLSEANVIIAVGRGLKSKDDIKLFEDLAREVQGEIACSRPIVDLGWMDRDRQVGFSGNIVRPKVYIAFGISGAPQHIAGMKDSEFIVAINSDESAPISKYCDLFVVGDMYNIASSLLLKIREAKSNARRVV